MQVIILSVLIVMMRSLVLGLLVLDEVMQVIIFSVLIVMMRSLVLNLLVLDKVMQVNDSSYTMMILLIQ